MRKSYEPVIGLEIHVELSTKSKLFCGCSADFGAKPNAHTCPVCLGLPGAKPSLNRKVVEYAVAAGLATNCRIERVVAFDRKNYFYPDNPHNYQISQLYRPICRDGYIELPTETGSGEKKHIRIREIHMEEDAGKLVHSEDGKSTEVDFNRAGVPLLEIVTEPDFRTGEEVTEFLEALRLIFLYLGISDCKIQEGSMRVDVNLSVREQGSLGLGVRTEMKNLGSFRAVRKAIEEETKRQIRCVETGEEIKQETRRYDEAKNTSYAMRLKESAADYRYFPDPELPLIEIEEGFIRSVKATLPELPAAKKRRYMTAYGLSEYDANVVLQWKELSLLLEDTIAEGAQPKSVANWLMVELLRLRKNCGRSTLRDTDRNEKDWDEGICGKVTAVTLAALISMVEARRIPATVAKQVFEEMYYHGVEPEEYVAQHQLLTEDNQAEAELIVKKVLEENPQAVRDYTEGKKQAFGYLVGQSMKALHGKADPARVSQLLQTYLDEITV